MVWIDNHAIPRTYFPTVVEARKKAISWLENATDTDVVFFYKNRSRRHYYDACVRKEIIGGTPYYSFVHYTEKYGMVSVPLYKNGKIKRGERVPYRFYN